jgi:hypothetical protein
MQLKDFTNNSNVASNRIKNIENIIGSEVFMGVIIKTVVFLVVTLHRFVCVEGGGLWHFRGYVAFTFRVKVCRFRNRLAYTVKL